MSAAAGWSDAGCGAAGHPQRLHPGAELPAGGAVPLQHAGGQAGVQVGPNNVIPYLKRILILIFLAGYIIIIIMK